MPARLCFPARVYTWDGGDGLAWERRHVRVTSISIQIGKRKTLIFSAAAAAAAALTAAVCVCVYGPS